MRTHLGSALFPMIFCSSLLFPYVSANAVSRLMGDVCVISCLTWTSKIYSEKSNWNHTLGTCKGDRCCQEEDHALHGCRASLGPTLCSLLTCLLSTAADAPSVTAQQSLILEARITPLMIGNGMPSTVDSVFLPGRDKLPRSHRDSTLCCFHNLLLACQVSRLL